MNVANTVTFMQRFNKSKKKKSATSEVSAKSFAVLREDEEEGKRWRTTISRS